jgi:hypothetical protein
MATYVRKSGKTHLLAFDWIELLASAEHTQEASALSDVSDMGDWDSILVLLDITASAQDATDTLDVFIDVSFDNVIWFNAIHFTQQAGNGSPKKEIAAINAGWYPTAPVDITGDASSGAVRPGLLGQYIRVRSTVVRANGTDEAHTFSVHAYIR